MGDLAELIYEVLRPMASRSLRPRTTYQDLIDQLPRSHRGLSPRSQELNDALGEIGVACMGHVPKLPALSSIVINGNTGRPGDGYYGVVHPDIDSDDEQGKIAAWEAEVASVPGSAYPVRLQ